MLNNELNEFVKKAYKHNLLTPLLTRLKIKNQIISGSVNIDKSKKQSIKTTTTIEHSQKQKINEEFTGRSSSKLSSSILLRQERRNTQSPQKLMRILSISQEVPQQLADVLEEISRIELETNMKLRCKTIQIRNIRIEKQQLVKYLQRHYSDIICEQIAKVFKIPQIMSFNQFQQWIQKIENLDLKQQIRLCFLVYDINNQAEITTHNLIELLKNNNNQSVELDILHMIKQTKAQISNQINNDIKMMNSFQLPLSLLRVKLDQSEILQQRRLSIISNDGRGRLFGKISQRNSFDLNVDVDQECTISQQKNTPTKKKVMLITQINNNIEQDFALQGIIQQKSERRKKKSKIMKDDNKISIDLNGFLNIWFPQKPNLFNDLIRILTAKP